MATKVVYTLREDKKELQKQFGCMNGIFQLFDRRYLLGLHRHGRNQKRLTPGENGEKEFKNSSEKVKEKRVSVESSRNSCSSSCSSTTFSSLSKRVKPEFQFPSEPASPNLPDIRDVVKDSMTRTIRVANVKNIQKEMNYIDSPRPIFVRQKSVEYERKDKNLARLSCDERESKYSLKSTLKVKEVPRLSLDSKQNSKNSVNTLEPGSNKKPSSGVVAKLMGLEGFSFTDSIVEVERLKIKKPVLDNELVSRFPLRVKNGSFSVYGEMEKRLSGIEFKSSGKDLRALKQILEAIKNKEESLDSKKMVKPVSPTVNGSRPVNREVKPVKLTKVNHGEKKNELFGRKTVKDSTPREKKVISGTQERTVLKKSKKGSTNLIRIKKPSNTRNPKTKIEKNEESCIETRNDQPKEDHKVSENDFVERLIEDKSIIELPKLTIEQQPSPVSVLDVFNTEDTPSPLKKKHIAFNDYETPQFEENHEMEWNQVGIYPDDFCEFKMNFLNEDHKYIGQILLVSGILKDLESVIRMVQIQPTGSLIKSDLFNFLEKKRYNECHKKNQRSKRKMIFDSVNDILLQKLTVFGMWGGKRRVGILNGEKLLKELCLEIDNSQTAPERCGYDEDDEVKNLVSVDVNKSEDWDNYCCEVPGVVLDIERLIFKDLINEVVNADMAQDSPGRYCSRQYVSYVEVD
ncbi:hypothetical protein L1887_36495 [Cichorium endivia]|nr:hypothetical protein L1887_36495 [Cichorium endivia]